MIHRIQALLFAALFLVACGGAEAGGDPGAFAAAAAGDHESLGADAGDRDEASAADLLLILLTAATRADASRAQSRRRPPAEQGSETGTAPRTERVADRQLFDSGSPDPAPENPVGRSAACAEGYVLFGGECVPAAAASALERLFGQPDPAPEDTE